MDRFGCYMPDDFDLTLTGKAAEEFEKQMKKGPTKLQKRMMEESRIVYETINRNSEAKYGNKEK